MFTARSRVVSLLAASLIAIPGAAIAADAGTPAPIVLAGAWSQFGRTATHPNNAPAEHAFTPGNVTSLEIAWRGSYGPNSTSESSPVVANGVVYIAGYDGAISAFNLGGCGSFDCQPLWRGLTNGNITSTPALAGGDVLVASSDRHLYAFPAAGCGRSTCNPLWTARLGDAAVTSSVAVAGGVAYVGTYGGRLKAFAAAGCGAQTCAPLWTGMAGGHLVSGAAVSSGSVFIGSDDHRLYVFPAAGCSAANCPPSWTSWIGGPAYNLPPLISGNTVFMGSAENFVGHNGAHLFAFSVAGCGKAVCKPLRAYDVGDGGIENTPAVSGSTLYVATQATPDPNTIGVVQAFPLNGCGAKLCHPRWTGVNFAAGFESSPVVAGNVVFVAKGPALGFPVDAGVFAYDARGCGQEVCAPLTYVQASDDQFYLSSSIAVAGGRLMFGSNDNAAGNSFLYVLSLPDGAA